MKQYNLALIQRVIITDADFLMEGFFTATEEGCGLGKKTEA